MICHIIRDCEERIQSKPKWNHRIFSGNWFGIIIGYYKTYFHGIPWIMVSIQVLSGVCDKESVHNMLLWTLSLSQTCWPIKIVLKKESRNWYYDSNIEYEFYRCENWRYVWLMGKYVSCCLIHLIEIATYVEHHQLKWISRVFLRNNEANPMALTLGLSSLHALIKYIGLEC